MNAFVSVLNPAVSDVCPFCSVRETIFHCFVCCSKLLSLFDTLGTLLASVGEGIEQMFILGFPYGKTEKKGSTGELPLWAG